MNKKHLRCFMTSITFQQLLPVQIDVYEGVWVCLKACAFLVHAMENGRAVGVVVAFVQIIIIIIIK